MTSVELIPYNSGNKDIKPVVCIDETTETYPCPTVEDCENIPYHARENARPFTYGNLPKDFKTSDLHHVELPDGEQIKRQQSPYQPRKSNRPSISPSRPVLHKTPSREKFEELLMERREQALQDHNLTAERLAKEAAIQQDLNELQQKLQKRVILAEKVNTPPPPPASPSAPAPAPAPLPKSLSNSPVLPKRAETPNFPTPAARCVSPYPNTQPISTKKPTQEPLEVAPHLVSFARDYSEFWYKPHITREEAVIVLKNAEPGTFLIRNSSTYKNAYGLVLRVAKPPLGISVHNGDELVRHFLLEPTTRGVHLKGCLNEPVFSSLSAFVYEHSNDQLALPCKLNIPHAALKLMPISMDNDLKQLLGSGAACNVMYLFSCDTESLTGAEAVRRSVNEMYAQKELPQALEVHFKVSQNGITVTDNTRRSFFRRHYATMYVSYCGIDPEHRQWRVPNVGIKTIFGFVARETVGRRDNQCHIFCDLADTQPASAIVSFTNKLLPTCRQTTELL